MSSFAKRFGKLKVQQAIELNEKTKIKNEMITKLYTIWKDKNIPTVYRQWVRQVAKYINSTEVKDEHKR